MSNVSSNFVILRNNKNREKKSIYSRYFKESLFSFKNRNPDSPSNDIISVSNMNICSKNAKSGVKDCRMSKTRSYADQVRELLGKDPMNQETLQMIRHRKKPPVLASEPQQMGASPKYDRNEFQHITLLSTAKHSSQHKPPLSPNGRIKVKDSDVTPDIVIKPKPPRVISR